MKTDLAVGRVAEDSRITFGSHVCVKDGKEQEIDYVIDDRLSLFSSRQAFSRRGPRS